MKITNLKQAEEVLQNSDFGNVDLISVVDYDDYYVFNTNRKNYKGIGLRRPLTAVQKSNGKVFAFNPLGFEGYAEATRKTIKYY